MTIATSRHNVAHKIKQWHDFDSGPQHTQHLSDQDLIDLYKKRIQEYCDFFNEDILPVIIRSFESIACDIQSLALPANIMRAIENKDFSDFEISSNHFDYLKTISYTRIGCFSYVNKRSGISMELDNLTDIAKSNISYKRLPMPTFEINPYHMRSNFQDYVNNTAGHEFAHAVVYFYYKTILNGMRIAKNLSPISHSPHGKTWKSIARAVNVSDRATSHNSTLSEENIRVLNEYYKTSTDSIKVKKKRTLKRFIYTCHCNDSEHQLSTRRHNDFQIKSHLICKKCNNKIEFTGKVLTI